MKSLMTLALGLATAAMVQAAPVTMSFSASGFVNGGVQFPGFAGPVQGSISWDSAAPTAPVGALTAIDLTIAGHHYALAEVGIANEGSTQTAFGGLFHGANATVGDGAADDFLIVFDRVNPAIQSFAYSILGKQGAIWWFPTQAEAHFVSDNGHLPEPATALLGVLALGVAGLTGRRRQPVSTFAAVA